MRNGAKLQGLKRDSTTQSDLGMPSQKDVFLFLTADSPHFNSKIWSQEYFTGGTKSIEVTCCPPGIKYFVVRNTENEHITENPANLTKFL